MAAKVSSNVASVNNFRNLQKYLHSTWEDYCINCTSCYFFPQALRDELEEKKVSFMDRY